MNWYGVKSHVAEAERILKDYGHPFTYEEILNLEVGQKDKCAVVARSIIVIYKHLQDDINENRMGEALDRLYSLCAMAHELWLYTTIQNEPMKKGSIRTRENVFMPGESEKLLQDGFDVTFKNKNKGGKNKIPNDVKNIVKKVALDLKKEGRQKKQWIGDVMKKLIEDHGEAIISDKNGHVCIKGAIGLCKTKGCSIYSNEDNKEFTIRESTINKILKEIR